jgi:hypothetical protein
VLTIQLESKSIVVEIVPEPIDAIMTIETILAKGRLMLYHERHIQLEVTLATGEHLELGDILSVAIRAQERFTLSRELVTV